MAVISVTVADVLLKKVNRQVHGSAITSLWFYMAIGLYLLQIAILPIAFIAGWMITIIGSLQTALYAVIVLATGVLL